jgi:predicted Zn-ribbon and HTH transcriptional regulator
LYYNINNDEEERYRTSFRGPQEHRGGYEYIDSAMTTESECPNCMKTGQTNILLTKIPFFREIMIVGFECPECGFRNNEVQFAGRLSDFGI